MKILDIWNIYVICIDNYLFEYFIMNDPQLSMFHDEHLEVD